MLGLGVYLLLGGGANLGRGGRTADGGRRKGKGLRFRSVVNEESIVILDVRAVGQSLSVSYKERAGLVAGGKAGGPA